MKDAGFRVVNTQRGRRNTSNNLEAGAWTEQDLVSVALQLGARTIAGWSSEEESLAAGATTLAAKTIARLRERILAGEDPLGEIFAKLRTQEERRDLGATYTPPGIVHAMVAWAQNQESPARVVDPGVGSARFLVRAAPAFPRARLIGVEIDPLAALIARANLAAGGFGHRSRIILGDYRQTTLGDKGRTLFIGNPPYIRHHLIEPRWKAWLVEKAREFGLSASQLAGLHVYFFLATVLNARPGDCGALITAAEWLDVNYGKLLRDLFLDQLGGQGIVMIEPAAAPFPDAASTAAITFFKVGTKPASVRLRRIKCLKDLSDLGGGRLVRRERLQSERRWS